MCLYDFCMEESMKFKNLIRAGVLFGVAAIMAGTIVVSSTQKNHRDTSTIYLLYDSYEYNNFVTKCQLFL